jgi:aspartyl-tRNA(Asn)/glutamyl-tRNA(Gln) amidotransferase subunit A
LGPDTAQPPARNAQPSLASLTAAELSSLIGSGAVTPFEAAQAYYNRISYINQWLDAFVYLRELPTLGHQDRGLSSARSPSTWSRQGRPIAGVPYALKDNICASGLPCTCGSRILSGYVPPYDATVTTRLAGAGAALVGKTNMDEFAMGSSCEHSAFFPTRNPWRRDLVPGGSSGGSAAAVAADLVAFALGSDTGGSVRQPAAFCGIVGLKPTYGLVSRYGLVAFASSLDQIGPLTKDVTDCAIVLSYLAGHDPMDATSAPVEAQDYAQHLTPDVRGLRLGVPREYMGEGIEAGVREAVERAAKTYTELGASVEECSLPHTEYGVATYYIIAPAEASSNLARFDGMRYGYRAANAGDLRETYELTRSEGFGEEVKRRIMIGTYVLSAGYYDSYYLRAQRVRTLVRQDFARAFERFDALIGPTAPTVAFALGAKTADPLQMYMNDVMTIPVNLAGLPAMSIPCGFADGLPVGLQLIGPHMGEPVLLRLGYAFEQASGIRNPKPPLPAALSGEVA